MTFEGEIFSQTKYVFVYNVTIYVYSLTGHQTTGSSTLILFHSEVCYNVRIHFK